MRSPGANAPGSPGSATATEDTGGALGLFTPEEGEEQPVIEIFDDDQEE